jgi:hypothetical protein
VGRGEGLVDGIRATRVLGRSSFTRSHGSNKLQRGRESELYEVFAIRQLSTGQNACLRGKERESTALNRQSTAASQAGDRAR